MAASGMGTTVPLRLHRSPALNIGCQSSKEQKRGTRQIPENFAELDGMFWSCGNAKSAKEKDLLSGSPAL